MRRVAAVAIACVFICLSIASAHETDNRALAEELLGAMEIQETIEKSFEVMKQMIPAQIKGMGVSEEESSDEAMDAMEGAMDLIMKEISWENLKDDYISIYEETFTEEELRGLITFYKSPVGRSFIEKQPDLMKRTMMISQKQMMELVPKIQELTREMEEQKASRSEGDE